MVGRRLALVVVLVAVAWSPGAAWSAGTERAERPKRPEGTCRSAETATEITVSPVVPAVHEPLDELVHGLTDVIEHILRSGVLTA